jgi:rubrerythrin
MGRLNMKCPQCNYEWEPRKPDPKACPRCKTRLDYQKKGVQ